MSSSRIVRHVLIAFLAIATALPFLASPANAAPNAGETTATVSRDDTKVLVKIAQGSLSIEDGALVARDAQGNLLESFGLEFIAPDNRVYPIHASVKGDVATLVPSKKVSESRRASAELLAKTQVADRNGYETKRQRDDDALRRLNTELAAGGTISALIGTAVGAVIGGVLAGTICGAAALPAIIACIPVGAGVGGIVGTVVIGGPAAVVSIVRYFQTITAPFKPVKR